MPAFPLISEERFDRFPCFYYHFPENCTREGVAMRSVYKRLIPYLMILLLLFPAAAAPAGTAEPNACTHQWKETGRREPGCTEAGWVKYRCSLCGKTKKQTLAALGHDYALCTVLLPPTCTEEGISRCTCSRDPSHYYDTPLPAKGHSWGEWRRVKAPSYTEYGSSEHVCGVCGAVERQRIPMLAPESAAFLLRLPDLLTAADLSARTESGSFSLTREITLFNAGSEALSVREFSYLPEQAPRPLEAAVELLPGEIAVFPLTVTLAEEDLPDTAFSFRFYAEKAGGGLCSSNAVSVDVRSATGQAGGEPGITPELTVGTDIRRNGDMISVLVRVVNSGKNALPALVLRDLPETVRIEAPALPAGGTLELSLVFPVPEEGSAPELFYSVLYVWEAGTEKDGLPLAALPPVAVPVLP